MDYIRNDYETILARKEAQEEGSYTCYLFEKGLDKILKKVGEESTEMVIAAKNGVKDETVGEICDLIYHTLVMMAILMPLLLSCLFQGVLIMSLRLRNFCLTAVGFLLHILLKIWTRL